MVDSDDMGLAEAIKKGGWWQGSILSASCLDDASTEEADVWWVISSQTCNLYNPDFEKIPVFEIVAARKMGFDEINPAFSKGNNPRLLHVQAEGDNETVAFEIDIQRRAWVNRRRLAGLGEPAYEIRDAHRESADWFNNQWLDNFAGWLSRSYTRVTLPDEFNEILKASKIQSVLDSKLRSNGLYGVYFDISSAVDEEWFGVLGLMPPPYMLEILLVSDETDDPDPFVQKLKDQLFRTKVKLVIDGKEQNLTRAEAAAKLGLTIISAGITGQGIGETSLLQVKSLIRYTINDYLSRAGAEPE
ncbi:hypothetical protein [Pseudomonas saliphila]|uniref:hypothetical protein n=1 Tax=Pseudomonas saliphila TaxID=2586906 RepID=UPI0015B6AC82|nr:hypothetical protein [Pseudomonas saliphila]